MYNYEIISDGTFQGDVRNYGTISGGMIPKIEGMADAIYEGVHEAVIIDGRVPHSVLLEMFSDRGSGTLFYRRGNR